MISHSVVNRQHATARLKQIFHIEIIMCISRRDPGEDQANRLVHKI